MVEIKEEVEKDLGVSTTTGMPDVGTQARERTKALKSGLNAAGATVAFDCMA